VSLRIPSSSRSPDHDPHRTIYYLRYPHGRFAGLKHRQAVLTEDRWPHNGGRGHVPSILVPTVLGMTLQCLGWRHSGWDGRIGLEVTGKTFPAGITLWCRPPFEGAAVLFRGGRREGGTGVGGTVSRNDIGLPAQCPQNVRDGHSAGWPNNAGDDFPSSVRGPAWWGFAFDSGARDMPEHLMLRSGEQV
jgi:hypothetical protein